MIQVQLADIEAAREFSTMISMQVSMESQLALERRLAVRREYVLDLADRVDLAPAALNELLGLFFAVRRHRREILAEADREILVAGIRMACSGEGAHQVYETITECGFHDHGLLRDLASEVLHCADPQLHPLWRRWVLDPVQETGALALIVEDPTDLYGSNDGATYDRVRFATEFLRQTLGAASLLVGPEGSPYAFDVFLAGIYGVYSSTMIKMRMTKEFNSLLPDLGEFMGRILGVKGELDADRG
ncbi:MULTISPECIES: hypothetical protein [Ferrimicrobium]|jgi:hypothetical protein|uniref:hypothetical protein n=1 Tax=Ferrimicrobium TaxID=121038 RepID=UPI0023F29FDE|nr:MULTISPECIES: hypothetical protein [Ferrimicrobium]MCL5052989.1 hypothetical protein [Gammaproteobacteria bacterium]